MADEQFDRVVQNAFRRGDAAEPCPDSSELAAFVGRALTVDERRKMETHVSSCGRCAAELAVLVRLEAPVESPAPAWSWWPRLRWVIPVATAVLVIAVWRELPREQHDSERTVTTTVSPAPQQPEPKATESLDKVAPRAAAPPVVSAPAARAPARTDTDQLSSPRRGGAASPKSDLSRFRAGNEADQTARVLPDAAPPATGQDRRAELERQEVESRAGVAQPEEPADTAAPPPPAAVEPPGRAAGGRGVAKRAKEETRDERTLAAAPSVVAESVALGLVVPAAEATQVRVIDRNVERSTDGGTSWVTERTGIPAMLTVGTCPLANVCWLAGQAGYVIRREPSGAWIDARLPVNLAVTKLSAQDALHAVATTADDRRYATSDGGKTWQPVP